MAGKMARPYWSGQIRISLVAFKVTLASALKRSSQVTLHEIDRKTGERIHHRNVNEDGKEVQREDIVKGFENDDKSYVLLEAEEIDAIKLPSSDTLELVAFVDIAEIPPMRYERPYFVLPDGKDANEIYAVIHQALRDAGKAGIGQLTMRGREELCAVIPSEHGLMLETLRYNAEVEINTDLFPDPDKQRMKSDYVALAKQLIEKNTQVPRFEKFHDHYHEALLELIKAKKAHRKPQYAKAAKPADKVVNFMDALRKSLGGSGKGEPKAANSKAAKHRKRVS
jgi:DNA end-binding protein Ku